MLDHMMPKMLIAGMVTVSITSILDRGLHGEPARLLIITKLNNGETDTVSPNPIF